MEIGDRFDGFPYRSMNLAKAYRNPVIVPTPLAVSTGAVRGGATPAGSAWFMYPSHRIIGSIPFAIRMTPAGVSANVNG